MISTVGCTSGQVVTDLETAVSAAGLVLPLILNAEGVPTSTVGLIAPLEAAATSCLAVVGTVTAAGGSTASMVAQITAVCAKIAVPVLPPNTPPNVITAINGLVSALNALMGYFGITLTNASLAAQFSKPAPTAAVITFTFNYSNAQKVRALKAAATAQNYRIQLLQAAGY
jgi:hypothetical protein